MKRSTLALPCLSLLALAGCDTPAPTAPIDIETPVAMAPASNNGNGVTFQLVFGPLTIGSMADADGNFCEVGLSEQEGGHTRSDFVRLNKNGTQTVHVNDKNAPLALIVDGETYTGFGHTTAVGTTNEDGLSYKNLLFRAQGTVTNVDGDSFRGSCSLHLRNSIDFATGSITVH